MTGPAGGGDWQGAWSSALDALELEADEVERLLRHRDALEAVPAPATAFEPPPGLGPMPLELKERARRLLQRQLDLSTQLAVAMTANRQQQRLVTHLHREKSDAVPVFVDSRG